VDQFADVPRSAGGLAQAVTPGNQRRRPPLGAETFSRGRGHIAADLWPLDYVTVTILGPTRGSQGKLPCQAPNARSSLIIGSRRGSTIFRRVSRKRSRSAGAENPQSTPKTELETRYEAQGASYRTGPRWPGRFQQTADNARYVKLRRKEPEGQDCYHLAIGSA
jgi:hypothetical protein